jgi:hypothetical protein
VYGVASLPLGSAVELEVIFEVGLSRAKQSWRAAPVAVLARTGFVPSPRKHTPASQASKASLKESRLPEELIP